MILRVKPSAFGAWQFKPNTDDIREAPALYIIEDLLKAGAKIKAYDPEAMDNVKEIFGDRVKFVSEQYESDYRSRCFSDYH